MHLQVDVKIECPDLTAAIMLVATALNGSGAKQAFQPQNVVPQPQQQIAAAPAPVTTTAPVVPGLPMQEVQPVQQMGAPVTPGPAPVNTVPTAAQTYTMEQLAVAATQLVDAGRRPELIGLLTSFGVQALTALPKEQYGNFATQLRAMGAKI